MVAMGDRPNPNCKKGKWLKYCGRTASACGSWCPDYKAPVIEPKSDNFRQEVKLQVHLLHHIVIGEKECIDRICAAAERMAERLPDVIDAEVDYLAGYVDCRDACQAHIRAMAEGKE